MNKRTLLAHAVICATFLTACGEGKIGGDGDIPIDVALQVGGIWTGTANALIFQPGAGGSPLAVQDTSIVFFTTEPDKDGNSQFRLVSDFALQARGEITVIEGADNQLDDILTGRFTAYAPDGYIFSDGSVTAACTASGIFTETVTGDFQEMKSISATYTCKDKDALVVATGNFQGDYDSARYEQPSSYNRVSGTWSGVDFNTTNNNVDLDLVVRREDGLVSGGNLDGCIYTGHVEIIDPAFNLYGLTLVVSACPLINGTYSGLATLGQGIYLGGVNDRPDELFYQVDNGSIIITQPVFQDKPPVL